MSKTKILMVCLGNICRSPLAEGILRSKLDSQKFLVDSAGTGDWHVGNKPDKRSIAVAQTNNLDISALRGRQFTASDFANFDHIYVMDQSNYRNVTALAPDEQSKTKVSLILDMLFPGENVEVPDPYYAREEGFKQVYSMLDQACDILAKDLQ